MHSCGPTPSGHRSSSFDTYIQSSDKVPQVCLRCPKRELLTSLICVLFLGTAFDGAYFRITATAGSWGLQYSSGVSVAPPSSSVSARLLCEGEIPSVRTQGLRRRWGCHGAKIGRLPCGACEPLRFLCSGRASPAAVVVLSIVALRLVPDTHLSLLLHPRSLLPVHPSPCLSFFSSSRSRILVPVAPHSFIDGLGSPWHISCPTPSDVTTSKTPRLPPISSPPAPILVPVHPSFQMLGP